MELSNNNFLLAFKYNPLIKAFIYYKKSLHLVFCHFQFWFVLTNKTFQNRFFTKKKKHFVRFYSNHPFEPKYPVCFYARNSLVLVFEWIKCRDYRVNVNPKLILLQLSHIRTEMENSLVCFSVFYDLLDAAHNVRAFRAARSSYSKLYFHSFLIFINWLQLLHVEIIVFEK